MNEIMKCHVCDGAGGDIYNDGAEDKYSTCQVCGGEKEIDVEFTFLLIVESGTIVGEFDTFQEALDEMERGSWNPEVSKIQTLTKIFKRERSV